MVIKKLKRGKMQTQKGLERGAEHWRQSQRLSDLFVLLRNSQYISEAHNIHVYQLQAQHNESSQLQKETEETKRKGSHLNLLFI